MKILKIVSIFRVWAIDVAHHFIEMGYQSICMPQAFEMYIHTHTHFNNARQTINT